MCKFLGRHVNPRGVPVPKIIFSAKDIIRYNGRYICMILPRKAAVHGEPSSRRGKRLCALGSRPAASGASSHGRALRHTLLFGEPLRAFSTKPVAETCRWPRVTNSGTVTTKRIGQSACLLPKGDTKPAYGRASQTERVWVVDDGVSNQRRSKIQSGPRGNSGE